PECRGGPECPPGPAGGSALELAAHRPVGLRGVDEADPDVLALGLAHVDEELGQLLGDLLLLLSAATLVPLDRDDRHGAGYAERAGSSSWTRRLFGRAPMILCAGSPSLKRIRVGIDITSYRAAVAWLSSTFSLTIRRSSRSAAISSSEGAITRHGPHQGAQKSTST